MGAFSANFSSSPIFRRCSWVLLSAPLKMSKKEFKVWRTLHLKGRPISSQQTNKSSMRLEREFLSKTIWTNDKAILYWLMFWSRTNSACFEEKFIPPFSRLLAWLCRHYPLRNIALGNMLRFKLYIFPQAQTQNWENN